MAFENITMNLSALNSVEAPNITIDDGYTISGIINSANNFTNDWLIVATLLMILVVLYMLLSNKNPFEEFGYDDFRAFNISLSSCSLIGLTIVEVGFSNNFYAVGSFITLWVLTTIGIYVYENQE